jgi:hypothetical protein
LTCHPKRTVCCVLAASALLPAALARPAWADGDPASDVLLEQDVFYPYARPTAPRLRRELDSAAAAAARAGVPVKVALIASPVDLGAITVLWARPQRYANYLDREISFNSPQPLLVVMPGGYGRQSLTARENAAVAALPRPAAATGDALASAAVTAIKRIAAADGRQLSIRPAAAAGGSSVTAILMVALSLVALATAAAVAMVTLRRQSAAARRPGRGGRARR